MQTPSTQKPNKLYLANSASQKSKQDFMQDSTQNPKNDSAKNNSAKRDSAKNDSTKEVDKEADLADSALGQTTNDTSYNLQNPHLSDDFTKVLKNDLKNDDIETHILERVITYGTAKSQREIFDENDNIASVSGEALQKLNIQNSKDLSQVFSGLYITNSGGSAYPSITFRGLHTSYYYSPSMRLYVDGVPQDIFFINQELLDVENVEIFRGMSGTLYGENAQAGIISINSNFISNKTKATLSTTFGNLDRTVMGSASGSIIKDKLYAKLSFKHSDFLGQLKDSQTGAKADTSSSNLARASFSYDDGKYYAGLDYFFDKSTNHDFFYLSDSELTNKDNLTHNFGTYGVPSIYRNIQTYALKAGYQSENINLRNVFSVQDRQMPITNFGSTWEENQMQFSDELKITKTYANNSTSLYGAFFQYSDFRHHFVKDSTRLGDNNALKNFALAFFSDHKIILPTNFEISLGVRYQYNNNHINYTKGVASTNSVNSFSSKVDFHNYSLRGALSYNLFNDHKFYISTSRGFKTGGFPNAIFSQGYSNYFKPETNYTAEIGYKGFFWQDRIYINADYFLLYTKNQQWNVLINDNPPLSAIGNLGNQISHGFEFEGKLYFLRDSFFMLNFAYIDARYAKGTRVPRTGQNLGGMQVQFLPKFSLNASIDTIIWRSKIANIFLNASLSFYSRIYFSETHRYSQAPYALFNFGARAEFSKYLTLSLSVMNATNTLYDSYGYLTTAGARQHQIGKLRSISATLSAKF
ncbi:TonB-dependent receptor [Helicobacter sp. MIT 01-3238]|uniref:TonB-dependent receptor n=1 Tax=Helicobacter sp. MIT 01-3238 TaxID=398627 RepID=UPI0011C04DEC|nr:TonB-dependent receptor [Helicobacter sp. MIT 01-3238]